MERCEENCSLSRLKIFKSARKHDNENGYIPQCRGNALCLRGVGSGDQRERKDRRRLG